MDLSNLGSNLDRDYLYPASPHHEYQHDYSALLEMEDNDTANNDFENLTDSLDYFGYSNKSSLLNDTIWNDTTYTGGKHYVKTGKTSCINPHLDTHTQKRCKTNN